MTPRVNYGMFISPHLYARDYTTTQTIKKVIALSCAAFASLASFSVLPLPFALGLSALSIITALAFRPSYGGTSFFHYFNPVRLVRYPVRLVRYVPSFYEYVMSSFHQPRRHIVIDRGGFGPHVQPGTRPITRVARTHQQQDEVQATRRASSPPNRNAFDRGIPAGSSRGNR